MPWNTSRRLSSGEGAVGRLVGHLDGDRCRRAKGLGPRLSLPPSPEGCVRSRGRMAVFAGRLPSPLPCRSPAALPAAPPPGPRPAHHEPPPPCSAAGPPLPQPPPPLWTPLPRPPQPARRPRSPAPPRLASPRPAPPPTPPAAAAPPRPPGSPTPAVTRQGPQTRARSLVLTIYARRNPCPFLGLGRWLCPPGGSPDVPLLLLHTESLRTHHSSKKKKKDGRKAL